MSGKQLIVAVLWAGLATAANAAAITVQVHNPAHTPEPELRQALDEAGWLLEKAGVEVRWIACDSPADSRSIGCEDGAPGAFVLSILGNDPRPEGSGDALGFAVLAGARNGAAVTYARVKGLTERNPECLRSYVLGSVIAHELGHLLLGTARHGDRLMKANWAPADFDAMRQRRLRFSKADAQQMRAQCDDRVVAQR